MMHEWQDPGAPLPSLLETAEPCPGLHLLHWFPEYPGKHTEPGEGRSLRCLARSDLVRRQAHCTCSATNASSEGHSPHLPPAALDQYMLGGQTQASSRAVHFLQPKVPLRKNKHSHAQHSSTGLQLSCVGIAQMIRSAALTCSLMGTLCTWGCQPK
jgi:hypothetical protein